MGKEETFELLTDLPLIFQTRTGVLSMERQHLIKEKEK
jgi:hypothetical protein